MSVLENILQQKSREVKEAQSTLPLDELRKRIKDFPPTRSLKNSLRGTGLAVIAEIKKASPSGGVLSNDFYPVQLARDFEQGGARALSVLTDETFFQGQKSYIQEIKSAVSVPVLRKDFIIDEYQVYESRSIGADAILLICRALSDDLLRSLYSCAQSLGLDVLVEVHSRDEIERANEIHASIIGINNRDLATFEVSLQRSLDLRSFLHDKAIAVSESGIKSRNDVSVLRRATFDAIVVGESLVTSKDRKAFLRELIRT